MAMIAFAALVAAHLLQLPGYATTCTQGNDMSFFVAAILSMPFLIAAVACLIRQLRSAKWGRFRTLWNGLFLIATAIFAGSMVYSNATIIDYTLLQGITPCGPDYAMYGSEGDYGIPIIAVAYGVIPALLALMAVIVFATSLRAFWVSLR